MTLTAVPTVHRKSSTRIGAWHAAWILQRRSLLLFALVPTAITVCLWTSVPRLTVEPPSMPDQTPTQAFMDISNAYYARDGYAATAVNGYVLISAAFVGAVLLSRRYETGAFRFMWTQGAGRTRILASEISLATLIVSAGSVAVTESYARTYLRLGTQINAYGSGVGSHWELSAFMRLPLVALTYTLSLLGAALLIGALTRRVVIALGLTVIVWIASQFAYNQIAWQALQWRPHTLVTNDPFGMVPASEALMRAAGLRLPPGQTTGTSEALSLSQGFLMSDGTLVDSREYQDRFFYSPSGEPIPADWREGMPKDSRLKEGQALIDAVASVGKPYIHRYRAPSDFVYYLWGWSTAFLLVFFGAVLLTGRVVRRR